ncbi:insulinase family protein [Flocculibacter collagenilyticus]|uniref:insulinase family protein n=1 Tax=Flocculibacter collagenilyticus TaxID=2744479 RepID=UPI0018F3FDB1|nr:insulinase family protein [Flocculibacter collagenilyticus]
MITSSNDEKKYKTLTLTNGLKVTIVQDVTAKKSAAALTVNVGHFDDPIDRQGMAHFLEHMLFLGTEKYPDPNEFPHFVSQHGGSHNAWTGTEHTSYFFDVNNHHFDGALDRFAHFFICPLLSEALIEKERHSIEAEYKMKLKDDGRRIYQVHKETLNPAHPFAKFSVGNTETLEDREESIRHELLSFYQSHYSSGLMTLAVLTPHPIEETEATIKTLFEQIPGSNKEKTPIEAPLYLDENLRLGIELKPQKPMYKLIVSFAMPAIDHMYRTKSLSFISHLIGYEGSHSLMALLKRHGWINGLSAGGGISGSNFKDFNISINLTQAGLAYRDEIIEHIFEYIDFLKNTHLPSYLYDDKKALVMQSFEFQEKTKPITWVSNLSVNMQHYPEQDYIYGDYAMEEFDEDEVANLLKYLSTDNLRIISISPDADCNKKAMWYHTPYSVTALPEEYLTYLDSVRCPAGQFQLPEPNPYIQTNPRVLEIEKDTELPYLLHTHDYFNFWFKQDTKFRLPKGSVFVALDCPNGVKDLKANAMLRLMIDLFIDSIIEPLYPAELAGMHYHVYAHQGGLSIHTSGLSFNQTALIERVISSIRTYQPNQMRFNEIKHQLKKHWANSNKSKPVSRLFNSLSSTLQPNQPCAHELAEIIDEVEFNEFCLFIGTLFDHIHIEAFMHGNWHESDAQQLIKTIKQQFEQCELCEEVERPLLAIKNKGSLISQQTLDHQDTALVVYFQSPDNDADTIAKYMMLNHILSPHFFQELRTKQQVGYLVGAGYLPLNRYPAIAFYIQSPNFTSSQLLTACETYFKNIEKVIVDIDEDDWLHAVEGLKLQAMEKDESLMMQNQRFWMAITNKDVNFNAKQEIVEAIKALTQKQVAAFAKNIFQKGNDCIVLASPCDELGTESFKHYQPVTLSELSEMLPVINR